MENYINLKSTFEKIRSDFRNTENENAKNNIAFGTSGFISVEMIGNDWRLKKSLGCKKDYNEYNRQVWNFYTCSINTMVEDLANEFEKEIKKQNINNLRVKLRYL